MPFIQMRIFRLSLARDYLLEWLMLLVQEVLSPCLELLVELLSLQQVVDGLDQPHAGKIVSGHYAASAGEAVAEVSDLSEVVHHQKHGDVGKGIQYVFEAGARYVGCVDHEQGGGAGMEFIRVRVGQGLKAGIYMPQGLLDQSGIIGLFGQQADK